jgi:hypothetical protein
MFKKTIIGLVTLSCFMFVHTVCAESAQYEDLDSEDIFFCEKSVHNVLDEIYIGTEDYVYKPKIDLLNCKNRCIASSLPKCKCKKLCVREDRSVKRKTRAAIKEDES